MKQNDLDLDLDLNLITKRTPKREFFSERRRAGGVVALLARTQGSAPTGK